MNRIILVGNGFDLAHNLPTGYKDFINWYWEVRGNNMINNPSRLDSDCLGSFRILWDNYSLKSYYKDHVGYQDLSGREFIEHLESVPHICEVKQKPFLKSLTSSIEAKGWVDVENEYYRMLKQLSVKNLKTTSVNELNSQMEFLRVHLVEYLSNVLTSNDDIEIQKELQHRILEPIRDQDLSIASRHHWEDFINKRIEYDENEWATLLSSYACYDVYSRVRESMSVAEKIRSRLANKEQAYTWSRYYTEEFLLPDNILILNFNYTDIADRYLPDAAIFKTNHIHGELSSKEGVIFGYGDELDKDYENLKELNENEYLRNMKSTKYLEADNYRKLLSFIDSAPFQIYIMGHSCGNSDRTLLNTLFEHDNCVSIKPFFHRKDDGSDNYLDIVQNISRNFTDMKKMRDRVVNKTYCEPLPQLKKAVEDNK